MTSDICLVFSMKALLYLLSICYWSMENIFQKSESCQIQLFMVFMSILTMAGYTFLILKINCGLTGDIYLVVFSIKAFLYFQYVIGQ